MSSSLIDRADNQKVKVAKAVKRSNSIDDNHNPVVTSNDQNCTFHFSIKGGMPMQSRASHVRVRIKGKGKAKQAFLVKHFYNAFFSGGWINFYASMDHDGIHFFKSRITSEPSCFFVSSLDFHSIRSEKSFRDIGIRKDENGKNEIFMQDTHAVIIKALDGDEIILRFSKKQLRIQWLERLNIIMGIQIRERLKNANKNQQPRFLKRLTNIMSFRK
jgi:hypothetical protein